MKRFEGNQKITFASTPENLQAGAFVLPAEELHTDHLLLEASVMVNGQRAYAKMNVAAEMYREALLEAPLRKYLGQMLLRSLSELIGSNA